jgi:hypothetical protein
VSHVAHLVHCTSVARARSIAREGLLPGDDQRCNYDCNRWLPLPGVYLSCSPRQIEQYRRAHDLTPRFAIVLVEAERSTLLPDEDLVDAFLGQAMERAMGMGWEAIRKLQEERDDAIPPSGDPFWGKVGTEFLRLADPARTVALDADDLETLVDWWADMEFFGDGGDVDPFEWRELKGRIVTALPLMEGLAPWERSKRHPGPIGFEGPARILCVATIVDERARIIAGAMPTGVDALNMLGAMVDGASWISDPSDEDLADGDDPVE